MDEPVTPDGTVAEYHLKEMQAPYREVQKHATAMKKAIANLPKIQRFEGAFDCFFGFVQSGPLILKINEPKMEF